MVEQLFRFILVDFRLSYFGPLHVEELVAEVVSWGHPEVYSVFRVRPKPLQVNQKGWEQSPTQEWMIILN